MSATPGALQLRLLQTVADVASEKNSTLVMPFPVELLRFFEHATGAAARDGAAERSPADARTAPELPACRPEQPPGGAGAGQLPAADGGR